MPKSKVRKRSNGRAVNRPVPIRDARPAKARMVAQRSLGLMLDELEELLHAVPLTYAPDDIVATIGHHHHATAVVNFLRTHDVLGIIAAMGGGAMIVPDAPAATNVVQDPTLAGQPIDTMSYADMVNAQRPAEAYAGPEDEVALKFGALADKAIDARVTVHAVSGASRRIPGAALAAELAVTEDEGAAIASEFDSTDETVGRIRDGLRASVGRPWRDMIGNPIRIPAGARNARNLGKPFESTFGMVVGQVSDLGDDTALLEGPLIHSGRAPIMKRVIVTWDQVHP